MVFSIFSPPDLHTCPLGNVSERSLDIEDEELQSSYCHTTTSRLHKTLSRNPIIYFLLCICECELQIF